MNKVATIDLKGNEYATVPQRLKAFRELHPRADMQTTSKWHEDGSLEFTTRIIADQADEFSAKGTGNAYYSAAEMKPAKAYEKLATISKGRALADLGFLNNGQIATSEEMLEFEDYKQEQIIESIAVASHREEFKEIVSKLTPEQKKIATPLINKRIEELKNGNTTTS